LRCGPVKSKGGCFSSNYLSWKIARWALPSFNLTISSRQLFTQALAVFQT
jgi:hypothetical protein